MELKTRQIVHVAVTQSPSDEWTAQQLREATPWGKSPNYLLQDRDSKYGIRFSLVAQAQGSPNVELPIEPLESMVLVNISWVAYKENALIIRSSFMENIYSAWSRNIRLPSTRIDPIKELASTFPASTIDQMRR